MCGMLCSITEAWQGEDSVSAGNLIHPICSVGSDGSVGYPVILPLGVQFSHARAAEAAGAAG